MNVGLAAQMLSSFVATAIDSCRKNLTFHSLREEKQQLTIRKVDIAFDVLNSRNPFAKGLKATVSLENLSKWMQQCDKLPSYLLALKDEKSNFLRENQ